MPQIAAASLAALFVLSAAVPARAEATESEDVRRLSFSYEFYVGGFNAMKLGLDAVLAPARYDMGMRATTKGVAGWFFDWRMTAESRGELRDGRVTPQLARGDSVLRGAARRQHIEYEPGGEVRAAAEPSVDAERREPVPQSLREGSRDLPAALFSALLAVGRNGRCDHSERVFDARRLYELRLTHAGADTLKANDYSPYGGPAIVCRMTVRLLAGRRVVDERSPEDRRMRTGVGQYATVWLAPVFDNAPLLPVRMQYEMSFGAVTAYLSAATLNDPAGPTRSLAARP